MHWLWLIYSLQQWTFIKPLPLILSFKFHIWPSTWALRQQQLSMMEMRPVVTSLND
jgi:hypothetical protein